MEYVRTIQKVRLKQVKDGRVRFAVDQVRSPKDVFQAVRRYYKGADREMLSVVCLDGQNAPTCFSIVSVGNLNTTRTRPAEILKVALVSNAVAVILIHNHPSGSLQPSMEDVEFTRSMKKACVQVDIDLYDHLVVGDDGFTSLRERGLV